MALYSNRPPGFIYDFDETMVDNYVPEHKTTIHDMSSRAAYKAFGEMHGYDYMINLSREENLAAFQAAATHSAEGGAWEILRRAGAINDLEMDMSHPYLQEIILFKDALHNELVEKYIRPMRDADAFIRGLGAIGLTRKQSISSTAGRIHLDTGINKLGWKPYFPNNHIISKESVKRFKPDPEAFDLAFRSLRLPEEDRKRTLAADDSPYGIVAAKRAGLLVCALTTSFERDELIERLSVYPKADQPDIIADSFADIIDEFNLPINRAA